MDIGTPFIAHTQAAELLQPGERTLDTPAMPADGLTALDADTRDPNFDLGGELMLTGRAETQGPEGGPCRYR